MPASLLITRRYSFGSSLPFRNSTVNWPDGETLESTVSAGIVFIEDVCRTPPKPNLSTRKDCSVFAQPLMTVDREEYVADISVRASVPENLMSATLGICSARLFQTPKPFSTRGCILPAVSDDIAAGTADALSASVSSGRVGRRMESSEGVRRRGKD